MENAVLKGKEREVESWDYSGVGISYSLIKGTALIFRNFHHNRLYNCSKHLSNCRRKWFSSVNV